jgi:hypothetical protein
VGVLRTLSREQKLLVVAVGMVLFIVSLFMGWVDIDAPGGVDVSTVRATEFDSWWIALALAVVALAISTAEALTFPAPVAWLGLGLGAVCAAGAFAWALFHLVDLMEGDVGAGVGAWVGLISSAVAAATAAIAWSHERP